MGLSVYPGLPKSRKVRVSLLLDLGCSPNLRSATVRRSYKQKLLETHPDKLPPTASEEERKAAEDLFHQVTLRPTPLPLRHPLTPAFWSGLGSVRSHRQPWEA